MLIATHEASQRKGRLALSVHTASHERDTTTTTGRLAGVRCRPRCVDLDHLGANLATLGRRAGELPFAW
jgi:hypothetical protein